jgi:hypothetical protein
LHFFFILRPFLSGTAGKCFFLSLRNHALTNFFDLSNIRFVSRGSSEMLRTSRCFLNRLFQPAGTRTLATVAPFLHSLSIDFKDVLRPCGEMNISFHRETRGGLSSGPAEELFLIGILGPERFTRFISQEARNHQVRKGGNVFGRPFISTTI